MKRTGQRVSHRVACVAGALALTAAGCGGDDGGSDAGSSSGGEGAAAKHSFTVAVVDPDLGSVSLLAAIEELKKAGHEVKQVEVAEPELAIEGIARGRFQFSGETTSTALTAAQQGAPLRLIGDLVANAWAVWSQSSITSCEDLDDKRIGVFSQGSVATVMVKNWVDQTCPGTKPQYLVLGESSTRYAALKAGEIDATALELSDSIQIEQEDTGKLRKLVDFETELPDLRPSTLYANAEFIEQNPEAAQAFIDAVKKVGDEISASPQYLEQIIGEHLEDFEGDALKQTAQAYSERGMFKVDALTPETLQYTIDFFEEAGSVKPGLAPEDVGDLRFVGTDGAGG